MLLFINVFGSPHKRRLLFVPLAWSCFRHVPDSSSLMLLVPGRSTFLQATKSQNVLTCKYTINQLHADFITKKRKRCYEVGQLQVMQVLQSRATFVTKWGFYYKSSAIQKATETNRGEQ